MSVTEKKNVQLVKVYVRQRPFSKEENEFKRQNVAQILSNDEICLKAGNTEKKYQFDQVFDRNSSQEEVYDVAASPLVKFMLSGYTCTMFAYGQTGTGKTYTMIGKDGGVNTDFFSDPSVGIIPRAAMEIFSNLNELSVEYKVQVSFIEIYNEEIRDLLVREGPPLKVYDDPDHKGATCVRGVGEKTVKSIEEVYEWLSVGTAERHTASTNLNRQSSRSHTVFTIIVNTWEVTTEGEEVNLTGKLHLIDLAGSENIGRSGATDVRAREAGSINKSLLTLGKVIKALALKMSHVPYRESKLTRILQDSLGGKTKTCMIATFSPTIDAFDETLSTLDYAHVARSVANCPTVNIQRNKVNGLTESQKELLQLRQALETARAGDGFYMKKTTYDKISLEISAKNERILCLTRAISELEEQISVKQKLYDDLRQSYEESNTTVKNTQQELEVAEKNLKKIVGIKDFREAELINLEKIRQTLQEICDLSVKNEDIYYKKYEVHCDSTLNNANIAQSVFSSAAIYLKEIENSSNNFCNAQTAHFKNAEQRVNTISQCETKNIQLFEQILTDLNIKQVYWELIFKNIFKDTNCSEDELKKRVFSYFNDSCQTQIKELDEASEIVNTVNTCLLETNSTLDTQMMKFKQSTESQFAQDREHLTNALACKQDFQTSLQNTESNIQRQIFRAKKIRDLRGEISQELAVDVEDCKTELELFNNMMQQLDLLASALNNATKPLSEMEKATNTFEISVLESSAQLSTDISEAINYLNNNKTVCDTKIESYENETRSYGKQFFNTFEAEVAHNNNDFINSLQGWSTDLETTSENVNQVKEQLNQMDNNFDSIMSNHKTHNEDLQGFVQKSTLDLEDLTKGVKSEVHAGDTPVKLTYRYPQKIPSPEKHETLEATCKSLFDSPQSF